MNAPLVPERRFRKSEPPILAGGLTGRVVWWNTRRGFGFIKHPDYAKDIYVHAKDVVGSRGESRARIQVDLGIHQEVTFDLVDDPKGLHAIHVVPSFNGQRTTDH